jgi:hypothetical protein
LSATAGQHFSFIAPSPSAKSNCVPDWMSTKARWDVETDFDGLGGKVKPIQIYGLIHFANWKQDDFGKLETIDRWKDANRCHPWPKQQIPNPRQTPLFGRADFLETIQKSALYTYPRHL